MQLTGTRKTLKRRIEALRRESVTWRSAEDARLREAISNPYHWATEFTQTYNEHWMDARRLKITPDRRTSLIVDPPDGRIPPLVPLTPERQKARAERAAVAARFNAGLPNSAEELSLPVRCIIRTDR